MRQVKRIAKRLIEKTIYSLQLFQVAISIHQTPHRVIGFFGPLPKPNIQVERISSQSFSKAKIVSAIGKHKFAQNFDQQEIEEFYSYAEQLANNSITKEQLINRLSQLRGGELNVPAVLAVIAVIMILLLNSWSISVDAELPTFILPSANHTNSSREPELDSTSEYENVHFWTIKEVLLELQREKENNPDL